MPGNAQKSQVVAFAQKSAQPDGSVASKLHVIELGAKAGQTPFAKRQAELFFPPDFADDFPVSMHVSEKYGVIYVVTKNGLLFVYDLETATAIYRNKISNDPVFIACGAPSNGGIYAVNRRGQVLLMNLNEPAVVPFVSGQLGNVDLALSLAQRGNLPGADALVAPKFEALFAAGDYKGAAEVAADSPKGVLRTAETIGRFQSVPAQPGQNSPLLQYFGVCLQRGKLNAFEAVELARLVLQQNKKQLLDTWMAEDKLECSEALGDMLQNVDPDMALRVYIKARANAKVVARSRARASLRRWASTARCRVQARLLVPAAVHAHEQPQGRGEHRDPDREPEPAPARFQHRRGSVPAAQHDPRGDELSARGAQVGQPGAGGVTDEGVGDQPRDVPQRRGRHPGPGEADALRPPAHRAAVREGWAVHARAAALHRASDLKRCCVNTHAIDPRRSSSGSAPCPASGRWSASRAARHQPRQNLQIIVNICKEYTEQLTSDSIISLLEENNSSEGLSSTSAPSWRRRGSRGALQVHPGGAKTGQIKEVERITRESNFYDPEKAKVFLMEAKLPDARLSSTCAIATASLAISPRTCTRTT